MQKRFWACVCLLWLLGLAGFAQAASDVRGVRLWRAPDNTRLVFDLTGPVQHNVFTLSAPNRVVVDIDGARMATALNSLNSARTPIRSVRVGSRGPEQLRVVLEMSTDVNPKSFLLAPNQAYGHRLVLDLFDQGGGMIMPAPSPRPVVTPAPTVAVTPPNAHSTPSSAPPASHFKITKISPQGQSSVVTAPPVNTHTTPVPVIANNAKNTVGTRTQGRRDIVIALDAGHGGEDPGALGPGGGLQEKNITLSIARQLQQLISQEKGFRAELVRTGDYFIPLRKRTEIARSKGADLFVSIHADAAPNTSASGASVYALSDKGATSETARWLADSENNSDMIGGVGLDNKDPMVAGVLLDLSMTATLSSSLDVGAKVLGNMGRMTALHKSRVEQAGFVVLKSPDIPSILVETGFISNPEESRKLNTSNHQRALAVSIQNGVHQFFRENPPPGTYLAWQLEQQQPVGRRRAGAERIAQADQP